MWRNLHYIRVQGIANILMDIECSLQIVGYFNNCNDIVLETKNSR